MIPDDSTDEPFWVWDARVQARVLRQERHERLLDKWPVLAQSKAAAAADEAAVDIANAVAGRDFGDVPVEHGDLTPEPSDEILQEHSE